ncbi:MAG: pilus assembly protein TadG-related protein [Amaricoccus sp.]
MRKRSADLWRNTAGATALFMAIGLIPVVGSVGLAVDSSIGYLLKSRMSKALDAAGLAAGRVAANDDVAQVARKYFDANFGEAADVTLTDFKFELDSTKTFVTLSAKATTPTVFMQIFGQDQMLVAAQTVIQRQTTGMELALVLDNTGSMQDDNKFTGMQKAAHDLVSILYGPKSEIDNLWVSVVPFVAAVNIGSARTGWLASGDKAIKTPGAWAPEKWKGCVMARSAPYDSDDTPPSVQPFTSLLWPADSKYNVWSSSKVVTSPLNSQSGPNLACPTAILPLTAARASVDAAISAMSVAPKRAGTAGDIGVAWGWRTISPRWRGLWGGTTPKTLPLDYKTELMDKVMVILTDGDNNLVTNDYSAYGYLKDLGLTTSTARTMIDTRMAATCTTLKAADKGVIIYTIVFGTDTTTAAKTLLSGCASSPSMYFFAPDNATLAKAFNTIAGQLANLRIVK